MAKKSGTTKKRSNARKRNTKWTRWFGRERRKILGIIKEGDAESRALGRRYDEVVSAWRSLHVPLNPEVLDSLAGSLSDSAYYGEMLISKLRELSRVKGRGRRAQVRSILLSMQEIPVRGQLRQIKVLMKTLPMVIRRLEHPGRKRKRPSRS